MPPAVHDVRQLLGVNVDDAGLGVVGKLIHARTELVSVAAWIEDVRVIIDSRPTLWRPGPNSHRRRLSISLSDNRK